MIESLDDALDALIREVAGPLARNLGETIVGLEKPTDHLPPEVTHPWWASPHDLLKIVR